MSGLQSTTVTTPGGDTVFISYARDDNESPPYDPKADGWVTFFWKQLRWALKEAGLRNTELWLDRYEIEPAERFTDKIEQALNTASMLIVVLSPNWVERPWCQQELSRFLELKSGHKELAAVVTTETVVPVQKRDVARDRIPDPLRERECYRFFDRDARGQVRQFYWGGLRDQDAYLKLVLSITDWIADRLAKSRPAAKPAPAIRSGRVVYVATATDELHDAWQRLANDLGGAGFTVLPADGRLPDNATRGDAEIRDALQRAELSVHLLGESDGMIQVGSNEGIVRRQLRLAREAGKPPRVLWAPKWLPDDTQTRRDPFEVVKRFGGIAAGEEIYGEEVTDLSQFLRTRLDPPAAEPEQPEFSLIVAAAAADDNRLVVALANLLQSDQVKIRLLRAGDPPTAGAIRAAAALIPWGAAGAAAIDALLPALRPLARRLIVLGLPGGEEAAKADFFREDATLEPLAAVPANRQAARDLLADIQVLPPGATPR